MNSAAASLSGQLAQRIDALARQLLPAGTYGQGRRHWRCGSIHGEAGQSLAVWLDGPRQGHWKDYADADRHGDALDLVAAIMCGGDLGEAMRWARDWLGLGELSAQERDRLEHEAGLERQKRERQAEREALRLEQEAKRLWLAAKPIEPGDLGWRYLRDRSIAMDRLPELPRALRTHPSLYNKEAQAAYPALVAAICGPEGRHINTHRIWLSERRARIVKAPLQQPKLSMRGGYAGGCVRLWKGHSGKPWKDMPAGETLLAGEGIEDTLTIACARPEWRACAVLSVSALAGLALPAAVTRLVWIGQNDPRGSDANRALAGALKAHRAAGRTVSVLRPPVFVKDVNEWAQWLEKLGLEKTLAPMPQEITEEEFA